MLSFGVTHRCHSVTNQIYVHGAHNLFLGHGCYKKR